MEEDEEEDNPVVFRKPARASSLAKFLIAKAKAKLKKEMNEENEKKAKNEKKDPRSPIFSDSRPDGLLSS